MLESERPQNACNLAPLRPLGKLDASADAAASAVVVVVAVFKVFCSGVVPGEVRVVEVAVWVVGFCIFVF